MRLRASRACGVAHTDLWYYPPCAGVARRPGEGRRHSSLMLESWTRRACPGALSPVGLALGRRRAACSVGHRTRPAPHVRTTDSRGLRRTRGSPHSVHFSIQFCTNSNIIRSLQGRRENHAGAATRLTGHSSQDTARRTATRQPRPRALSAATALWVWPGARCRTLATWSRPLCCL